MSGQSLPVHILLGDVQHRLQPAEAGVVDEKIHRTHLGQSFVSGAPVAQI
jgi:hypothetical protein